MLTANGPDLKMKISWRSASLSKQVMHPGERQEQRRETERSPFLFLSLGVRRGWHCEKSTLSHWDVWVCVCAKHGKCLKIWALEVESPPVVIGHHVLICAPGSCRRSSGPQLEETMVSLHHPNPSQHQITHNKTHMSQKECICFLLSAFDEESMWKFPTRESNTCLWKCLKSGQKSKDNPPTLRQISVRWMTSTMSSTFWLTCLHCKVLCISTRVLLQMQKS